MPDWLEHLVRDTIWRAVSDFFHGLEGKAESEINAKLASLTAGQQLSSSPLVTVLAVDPAGGTLNILIRGRLPFMDRCSAFVRMQVVMGNKVHITSSGPLLDIRDIYTLIGDLRVGKANVFDAALAFGYDRGAFIGRGMVKILPAGFGLDVFLGGLDDRGMMVGFDVDFPVPIPLWATGLGLAGIGGDYAHNFKPRIEKAGVPVDHPSAENYVAWARSDDPDRWVAGPPSETDIGVGIRCDFGTEPDRAFIFSLDPLGMAVLTPGPVFILGGAGRLIRSNSVEVKGFFVVDIPSASLALGMGANIKLPKAIPPVPAGTLVDANGTIDAFFSFQDSSIWYLNIGTDAAPINAKVMNGLFKASLFIMINSHRLAFGAAISIGGEWSWWKITLIARLGAAVAGLIGWDPVLLEGDFKIFGQLGIKVWKFGFMLTASAEVRGHTPRPTILEFKVHVDLDMPWPIPDISFDKSLDYSDATPTGPVLNPPLMVGAAVTA